MHEFIELRKKYPTFIYHSYEIEETNSSLNLSFNFEIAGLTTFKPVITIPKPEYVNIHNSFLRNLVFHVGMIELVSYFKCTCSPNVIIEAGYLNKEQMDWFKKLYYYGLGEFRYLNHIDVSMDELMNLECSHPYQEIKSPNYVGSGNLIPVGGGKDSVVSLELLKDYDNHAFIINPKSVTLECTKLAGLENKTIGVKRVIDPKLIDLNKEGFLNGHTPFSSLVAFLSYFVSFLYKKRYIVLSNEASANESTVIGTDINHQYSKSFQFEKDFNQYTKKYFGIDITYFSFLRPLSELEIALLFSRLKKYHKVFKSCNVGSKESKWDWCCHCPKCLFVYIILSPFLSKEELVDIFGCDLYEKEELLEPFLELLGYRETKPFECVGEIGEVRYAVSLAIKKYKELPFLLEYYKEHYKLVDASYLNDYNKDNDVPEEFQNILRKELEHAREINQIF